MAQGQIRIIGGEWRGRKLTVPDVVDLRPTPDRVRETVFNWLTGVIAGAHCLDAFAGSGALGFEALSRGAAQVVMVDEANSVTRLLQETAKMLKTDKADIYRARIPGQLKQPSQPFDIVFLDPPFQQDLLIPTCFYLEENHYLAARAYIYLEAKEIISPDSLPRGWQIIKSKKQARSHII